MNVSGSASHNIDKVSTTRSSHSQAAKQPRASYTRQTRQHTRIKQDRTEMVTVISVGAIKKKKNRNVLHGENV